MSPLRVNRREADMGAHSGFSMIEVLVSLMIVVLGLLGLAGMQVRMQQIGRAHV